MTRTTKNISVRMHKKQPLIMLIEDDKNIREQLTAALPRAGFRVANAASAEEALKTVREIQPDLILCDIKMPGMSGLEFKGSLQKDEDLNSIPFVFASALTGRDNIRAGMTCGADDYILKPFRLSELVEVIEIRLDKEQVRKSQYMKSVKSLRESLQLIFPHELITPITVIYGMTDFLQSLDLENSKERELTHEMLQAISDSASRLKELTDKFHLALTTALKNELETGSVLHQKHHLKYND